MEISLQITQIKEDRQEGQNTLTARNVRETRSHSFLLSVIILATSLILFTFFIPFSALHAQLANRLRSVNKVVYHRTIKEDLRTKG